MSASLVNALVGVAGWTLAHMLWEAAIVYCFYILARLSVSPESPKLRYAVGCVAMVILLMATVGTLVSQINLRSRNAALAADSIERGDATFDRAVGSSRPEAVVIDSFGRSRYARLPEPGLMDRISVTVEPVMPFAVTAWAAGFLVFSGVQAVGILAIGRMLRRCVDPAIADVARWQHTATSMGITLPVQYLLTRDFLVPVAVGWFKPAVLVPVQLCTNFSVAEIDAMVAHELAHVRRYDFAVHQLQMVLGSVLYFHPCVWLLFRRIDADRELCCDADAVRVTGDPRLVATTIRRMTASVLASRPRSAMGFGGGSIVERVAVLMGIRQDNASRAASLVVGLLAGTACLTLVGADFYNRAAALEDRQRAAATHESIIVTSLLSLKPAGPNFDEALVAGLQAAKQRAPANDVRVRNLVSACSTGMDPDVVWRAFVARQNSAAYPVASREYVGDWRYADPGSQRALARMMWQYAKASTGIERRQAGRAAIAIGSMRRELSGVAALATIVFDDELAEFTGLDEASVHRLRWYVSLSQDSIANATLATRDLRQMLDGQDQSHDLDTVMSTIFQCRGRLPEVSYTAACLIQNASSGPVRQRATQWMRTMASDDAIVQKALAVGSAPDIDQRVIMLVAEE